MVEKRHLTAGSHFRERLRGAGGGAGTGYGRRRC